ncbi:hypothetical protein BV25DRAFT_1768364, partial [Artomyces pyxidatus]
PQWLLDDHAHLVKASEDDNWLLVVGKWTALEELLGFPSGQGKKYQLAATGRPSQVSHWIGRGHDFLKTPDIGKPLEFATVWRNWWIRLQPDWRGNKWPLARSGGAPSEDWAETLKCGRNGFEVILITLSWW